MKHNWVKVKEFIIVYNYVKKNITKNDNGKNPELIDQFMRTFEEFFYQSLKLEYVTKSNVGEVLIRLSRINRVGYLVNPFKGKESYSFKDKTGIFINPDSSKDVQTFSIFKELSRVSSSYDRSLTNSVACSYVSDQDDMRAENEYKLLYLDLGFRLLEDGINLDMAENIYARYKKVPRSPKKLQNEKNIFGRNINFLSNFKYQPSFQELTTLIGRKVLTNGRKLKDEQVLYILSRLFLKEGFTKDFILGLASVFGKEKMFDIIGKLGIIYKREMDNTKSFLGINPYLRVMHAKKALKDVYSMIDANNVYTLKRVS